MVLWEMLILVITVTVCMCCGISVITESILNAIDRYKTKRAAKTAKAFSEAAGQLSGVFNGFIEKWKDYDAKKNEEFKNEFAEKVKQMNKTDE